MAATINAVYHFLNNIFPNMKIRDHFLDAMSEELINPSNDTYIFVGENDSGRTIMQQLLEKTFTTIPIIRCVHETDDPLTLDLGEHLYERIHIIPFEKIQISINTLSLDSFVVPFKTILVNHYNRPKAKYSISWNA